MELFRVFTARLCPWAGCQSVGKRTTQQDTYYCYRQIHTTTQDEKNGNEHNNLPESDAAVNETEQMLIVNIYRNTHKHTHTGRHTHTHIHIYTLAL